MSQFLKSLITKPRTVAATFALTAMTSPAFALGGLDVAKSTAEDVKTGLYSFVGVMALIYLIYLGVMAFTEKKSWADFGWGVVHVSLVGGAVAIGGWAWTLFA